jgi:hypothetical protein
VLNHSNVLTWLEACSPKASFSIQWVSAAVLLSLKQNVLQILDICRFDNSRHTWKWCRENSPNLEQHSLTKMPVGWLTVGTYSKRHVVAQAHSANGLRSIFNI